MNKYWVIAVPAGHGKFNYFGQTNDPLPAVGRLLQATPIPTSDQALKIRDWLQRPGNGCFWVDATIRFVEPAVLTKQLQDWLQESYNFTLT